MKRTATVVMTLTRALEVEFDFESDSVGDDRIMELREAAMRAAEPLMNDLPEGETFHDAELTAFSKTPDEQAHCDASDVQRRADDIARHDAKMNALMVRGL